MFVVVVMVFLPYPLDFVQHYFIQFWNMIPFGPVGVGRRFRLEVHMYDVLILEI